MISVLRKLAARLGRSSRPATAAPPDGELRDASSAPPALELRALEGADRGRVFRVACDEGAEVAVGRWAPAAAPGGAVALSDRTVSARQATLRSQRGAWFLEHFPLATNPTLVNGASVTWARLRHGDRIGFGEVVLRVALSGERGAHALEREPGDVEATLSVRPSARPRGDLADDTTEVRVPALDSAAHLRVVGGLPALGQARFALREGESRVGRAPECEVHLPDRNVSRLHAVVVCRDGLIELVHRSRTNITEVNGEVVGERRRLHPGDEIQLSGRVLLRLDSAVRRGAPARRTLLDVMEERTQIEEVLAEFEREGSFVDVDVVDSYGMKLGAPDASVVVSFERLRAWLRDLAGDGNGRFLNSNGDECMFFFASVDDAVDTAVGVLEGLADFNRERNALERDFRLRIGIHTGRAAVDLQRGYAFSPILDAAGHIQKAAGSGGLLISGETWEALGEERRRAFEKHGEIERHRIALYRWSG